MDVFSVSKFNALIKHTLDREYLFKNAYISGTIANLKHHSNGHYYFTLKDDKASIDVTLWQSTALSKSFTKQMENGLLVTMKGSLNFWEKMGRLNLVCNDMQIGEKSPYQMEYERLKAELTELGYFSEEYKKALPEMPNCIGLVTSESGAVMHDILHIAAQRNPLVKFKLFSVPVQGDYAGPIIAKGIEVADADQDIDLIIVGRGGGSMEDLWCFNDKNLVEAIFKCKTPVISAVGHETDFTLCDFVADVRGATPSHAAELAVYPLELLRLNLQNKVDFLNSFMIDYLTIKRQELQAIFNRKLGLPVLNFIHKQQSLILTQQSQLQQLMNQSLQAKEANLHLLQEKLILLNPINYLLKGYSKIEKNNTSITSATQLSPGDTIKVTLADGSIMSEVKEII